MTQDQVATRFGLSRSTVAQIELGNRSVSSLELKRLAELYGRDLREFLLDEFEERDALVALFRVHPDVADDPRLSEALRGCAALCREASSLERVLELAERRVQPAEYHLAPPQAKWDAIQQGEKVANLERRRLDLGHAPVWDVPEILERQGVRCTEMPLPDDLSGLFLAGGEVGLCIVVNSAHHLRRRAFSYAHEYGHLLLDRSRRGDVCRYGAREELTEVRANTFAASFLLPADGVYDFLRSLGKAEEARATATVFDEARPLVVQHRTPARSQDVQLYDIVHLAHHFGVSFEAAVYRLRNLRVVTGREMNELLGKKDEVAPLQRVLDPSAVDERLNRRGMFRHRYLTLALEAYRRELISRRKLGELARLLEMSDDELEELLRTVNLHEEVEMGPEDVRVPN